MINKLKQFQSDTASYSRETFDRRRALLSTALIFSTCFFFVYYTMILLPNHGLQSVLFRLDLIAGGLVPFSLIISILLSNKIKKEWVLLIPSLGCVLCSLIYLFDETYYLQKTHMWVYPQVVGVFFATAIANFRYNFILSLFNCLSPFILVIFYEHLEVGQILEDGAIVYYSTLAGVFFSYKITMAYLSINQKLKLSQWLKEVSQLGSWEWDLISNKVLFDERYCEILGYEVNEIEHTFEFWENNTFPFDKIKAVEKIQKYLAGELDRFQTKFKMKHKDGHWVTIVSQGAVIKRDQQGNPLFFTGTHLDVSPYEVVQKENEKLKDLNDPVEQTIKIGGWELDAKSMETSWTQGVYDIYGIPSDIPTNKVQGINYYAEHERARITKCVEECLAEGIPFDENFDFISEKGTNLVVRSIGKPIYDDDKNILALRGCFQDITEQIAAQNNLKYMTSEVGDSHALLKTINDNAAHAMIATTTEGIITSFNKSAEKMIGYSAEELIGKLSPAVFHDLDEVASRADEFSKDLNKEILPGFETFICHTQLGLENHFEWTYVHKSGSKFPVILTITALKDKDGILIGYLGLAQDLSIQKKLEKEMQEKQVLLEQERLKLVQTSKLATLGEMAAGVAHEINNPLAIISGFAAILAKDDVEPEKKINATDKIKRSIERISKIVNGLKKFSRTTGKTKLLEVSLLKLIDEIIELTEAKSKRHKIPVKNLICDNVNIYIDEIQIEQILVNLIANAVDENAEILNSWIELSYHADDKFDQIIIKDSGKGIPDELIEKLFDPFYTTKEVGKGTGLGLSISRSIATDHGGSLEYKLIDGHTAFILSIPKVQKVRNET